MALDDLSDVVDWSCAGPSAELAPLVQATGDPVAVTNISYVWPYEDEPEEAAGPSRVIHGPVVPLTPGSHGPKACEDILRSWSTEEQAGDAVGSSNATPSAATSNATIKAISKKAPNTHQLLLSTTPPPSPQFDEIFTTRAALIYCNCNGPHMPHPLQSMTPLMRACFVCGMAHWPDPCGFHRSGRYIFPNGELVDPWFAKRQDWNIKNGHHPGCALPREQLGVTVNPMETVHCPDDFSAGDCHTRLTIVAAGMALLANALLPSLRLQVELPSDRHHIQRTRTSEQERRMRIIHPYDPNEEVKQPVQGRKTAQKKRLARSPPIVKTPTVQQGASSDSKRRPITARKAAAAATTLFDAAADDDELQEKVEADGETDGLYTSGSQLSHPGPQPLARASKNPRQKSRDSEDNDDQVSQSMIRTNNGIEPHDGFQCQARCGRPDDERMVVCANSNDGGRHVGEPWWHYECVPYANDAELPRGDFYCPPCLDAGCWPEGARKPEVLPAGQKAKEECDKYTDAQLADQNRFPNPLIGSNFCGTPLPDGNGWTEEEQRACIFQMKRIEPFWRAKRGPLWAAVATEMRRMQGVDKSENAVKLWWQRNGRLRCGYDERGRVRSGYENKLQTSMQGSDKPKSTKNRVKFTGSRSTSEASGDNDSVKSDRSKRSKKRDVNVDGKSAEKSVTRKRKLAVIPEDSDDELVDKPATSTIVASVTPLTGASKAAVTKTLSPIKTTGLGKGKGAPKRFDKSIKTDRAPPAQKQPRSSISKGGKKPNEPTVVDTPTISAFKPPTSAYQQPHPSGGVKRKSYDMMSSLEEFDGQDFNVHEVERLPAKRPKKSPEELEKERLDAAIKASMVEQ